VVVGPWQFRGEFREGSGSQFAVQAAGAENFCWAGKRGSIILPCIAASIGALWRGAGGALGRARGCGAELAARDATIATLERRFAVRMGGGGVG